jgi:hypothetical protein
MARSGSRQHRWICSAGRLAALALLFGLVLTLAVTWTAALIVDPTTGERGRISYLDQQIIEVPSADGGKALREVRSHMNVLHSRRPGAALVQVYWASSVSPYRDDREPPPRYRHTREEARALMPAWAGGIDAPRPLREAWTSSRGIGWTHSILAAGFPTPAFAATVDRALLDRPNYRVSGLFPGPGWPRRALATGGFLDLGLAPWDRNQPRVVPLRPIWRGVVINTISYALCICLLLTAVRTARGGLRKRRGRCPRCDYELRGALGAGCPECGWRRGGMGDA